MSTIGQTNQATPAASVTSSSASMRRVVDVTDVLKHLNGKSFARHRLQSPELYELLTYGDGLPKSYEHLGLGNWNRGDALLRAVMTYLAQRAFAVHRLPWHHDRSCGGLTHFGTEPRALKFMRTFERVEQACKDIQELKAQTFAALQSVGCTHVRLRRGLRDIEDCGGGKSHESGYATRFAQTAHIAERLGLADFEIPVDVLTSWGGGGYSQYSVVVEREVPIEEVLCFSEMLASWETNRSALEPGEWILLNRAVDGRMRFAASCVVQGQTDPAPFQSADKKFLNSKLAELSRVYGPATSMYRDTPSAACREASLLDRVRRAWRAFKSTDS
jgi:hypothetical protein